MDLVAKLATTIKVEIAAFLNDVRGVSTVEYALMVVAVIAAVGGVAALLGGAFEDMFDDLSKEIGTAVDNVTT